MENISKGGDIYPNENIMKEEISIGGYYEGGERYQNINIKGIVMKEDMTSKEDIMKGERDIKTSILKELL